MGYNKLLLYFMRRGLYSFVYVTLYDHKYSAYTDTNGINAGNGKYDKIHHFKYFWQRLGTFHSLCPIEF